MNAHAKVTFTEGVRDDTSLIIGVAGASGSGKTVTALLLATGLAGDEPIAFIDTEGGRARHYFPTPNDRRSQDELLREFLFRVQYHDMKPPFTPKAMWEAISAAIDIGARVVVVDSTSDEWEGVGGLHDMHRDEMARLAKKPYDAMQDWELNKFNFPGWAVPKAEHKTRLMKNLRQVRAHVIFCFRAREVTKPVEVEDNGRKRMTVQKIGWQPVCEQNMLYDLTISFMVAPDNPGVPLMQGNKFYGKLNPPYAQFFTPGQQVSIDTGHQLRSWASGRDPSAGRSTVPDRQSDAGNPSSVPASDISPLDAYDRALAAEAFRSDLEEAHQRERGQFAEAAEPLRRAARAILTIHTDRVEGRLTAEAAAAQIRDVIKGVQS